MKVEIIDGDNQSRMTYKTLGHKNYIGLEVAHGQRYMYIYFSALNLITLMRPDGFWRYDDCMDKGKTEFLKDAHADGSDYHVFNSQTELLQWCAGGE